MAAGALDWVKTLNSRLLQKVVCTSKAWRVIIWDSPGNSEAWWRSLKRLGLNCHIPHLVTIAVLKRPDSTPYLLLYHSFCNSSINTILLSQSLLTGMSLQPFVQSAFLLGFSRFPSYYSSNQFLCFQTQVRLAPVNQGLTRLILWSPESTSLTAAIFSLWHFFLTSFTKPAMLPAPWSSEEQGVDRWRTCRSITGPDWLRSFTFPTPGKLNLPSPFNYYQLKCITIFWTYFK